MTKEKNYKCGVCGKAMGSAVPASHIKTHGLTTEEYKRKYPAALEPIQEEVEMKTEPQEDVRPLTPGEVAEALAQDRLQRKANLRMGTTDAKLQTGMELVPIKSFRPGVTVKDDSECYQCNQPIEGHWRFFPLLDREKLGGRLLEDKNVFHRYCIFYTSFRPHVGQWRTEHTIADWQTIHKKENE